MPARQRLLCQPAFRSVAALFASTSIIAGCSVPQALCFAPSATSTLTLHSTAETNDRTALAVDLVFVQSAGLAGEIAKLDARAYFSGRQQLLRDHPLTLSSRFWELVPGQRIETADLDPPCSVEAVLLFADYQTQGAHRLSLDGRDAVDVILGAETLALSE